MARTTPRRDPIEVLTFSLQRLERQDESLRDTIRYHRDSIEEAETELADIAAERGEIEAAITTLKGLAA